MGDARGDFSSGRPPRWTRDGRYLAFTAAECLRPGDLWCWGPWRHWFTIAAAAALLLGCSDVTPSAGILEASERFNAIMAIFDEAPATQVSSDDAPYPDPRIEIGLPAGTDLLAVTRSGDLHFADYHGWEYVRHRVAVRSMP